MSRVKQMSVATRHAHPSLLFDCHLLSHTLLSHPDQAPPVSVVVPLLLGALNPPNPRGPKNPPRAMPKPGPLPPPPPQHPLSRPSSSQSACACVMLPSSTACAMAARTASNRAASTASRTSCRSTPASSASSASVLPPHRWVDNSSAVMPKASAAASSASWPYGPNPKPPPCATRAAGTASVTSCAKAGEMAPIATTTATMRVAIPANFRNLDILHLHSHC